MREKIFRKECSKQSVIMTPVPEIATRIYGIVSEGIYNYFEEGMKKVYLIKSELSHCDLVFLQIVCSATPLSPSDVITLENKSQFVFSPPRKT
jgi:hypothetical protein